MLKSIKAAALALVITAAMVLSMTDVARAYYCYYEWFWTPYGYVYQYVCY